jgi:membrane-bound serine protease (ClpP class)
VQFDTRTGNLVLLTVIIGLLVGGYFYLRFFPTSRLAKLFTSHSTVGELGVERPDLLQQTGTALTQLRPSGTALINGKRVDVVTEGGLIEKGTPVKVVAVEGLRVVVRAQ